MSTRSVLVAGACVLMLALAGCSSAVAGSPQAALPVSAISALDDAAEDLSLPTDVADNPIDPGDLLESLGGADGPSLDPNALGDLLGNLGGADGPSLDPNALGDLLANLGGAAGSADLGDLGSLAGIASPECLSMAGQSMALGMLMLAPMMGQALTESDIDQAFAGLKDVPPELQDAVATLHAAAQGAIGASPTDAGTLMSDPAVDDAMDAISQYMDDHCGGQ